MNSLNRLELVVSPHGALSPDIGGGRAAGQ